VSMPVFPSWRKPRGDMRYHGYLRCYLRGVIEK
jgi:hypothetical protein